MHSVQLPRFRLSTTFSGPSGKMQRGTETFQYDGPWYPWYKEERHVFSVEYSIKQAETVMSRQQFRNRTEAGQLLATKLTAYANRPDVLILALPRGGVPVAFEIARALHVALDVIIVRKLGVPGQEELAMGAIAAGGVRILNEQVIQAYGLSPKVIDAASQREQRELERRARLYRGGMPMYDLRNRTVILVDDGIATGATIQAAITTVRELQAARIIVAVPIAAPSTCEKIAAEVDELICYRTTEAFFAIGLWYEQFPQTSDEEVRELLAQARKFLHVSST